MAEPTDDMAEHPGPRLPRFPINPSSIEDCGWWDLYLHFYKRFGYKNLFRNWRAMVSHRRDELDRYFAFTTRKSWFEEEADEIVAFIKRSFVAAEWRRKCYKAANKLNVHSPLEDTKPFLNRVRRARFVRQFYDMMRRYYSDNYGPDDEYDCDNKVEECGYYRIIMVGLWLELGMR